MSSDIPFPDSGVGTVTSKEEIAMQSQRITSIVMGVIVIVVGLVLEFTVLSQTATAGGNANIGSFPGCNRSMAVCL